MLLKKITVFLAPLLIFLLLELSFFSIHFIYLVLIVATLILLLEHKFLIKEKIFSADYLYLTFLSLLFFFTTTCFLFIIGNDLFRHSAIIIFCLILLLFFDNIFSFYNRSFSYKQNSLENISAFMGLLIFFLLIISLSALDILLNLPLWILALILIVVLTFLLLESFWVNKIEVHFKWLYLLIFNIIVLEFFAALSFLPTNFYINSIMLTLVFYFMWGLVKFRLKEKLNTKVVLRYLVISASLIILIVFTSSWT